MKKERRRERLRTGWIAGIEGGDRCRGGRRGEGFRREARIGSRGGEERQGEGRGGKRGRLKGIYGG